MFLTVPECYITNGCYLDTKSLYFTSHKRPRERLCRGGHYMFKHSAQSKNTNVHRTQRNGRHDTRREVTSVTLKLVQSKSLLENLSEHSWMWANLYIVFFFFDKLLKDTVTFGHSHVSPVRQRHSL